MEFIVVFRVGFLCYVCHVLLIYSILRDLILESLEAIDVDVLSVGKVLSLSIIFLLLAARESNGHKKGDGT